MWSKFVVDPAANHETRIGVAVAEAEGTIVGGDDDEIIIAVDEGNAASAVKAASCLKPSQAATNAGQVIDVLRKIEVTFNTDEPTAYLPIVSSLGTADQFGVVREFEREILFRA